MYGSPLGSQLDIQAFLDVGKRVVLREAASLDALANSLGEAFVQAVALLADTRGRAIVSGMGKSGHVGRKIAATLASTGQPAHFVHPAEASHGDLGMIATDDTVIVLSNSGDTPELADIISYTRRCAIPMIGVASRANSELIQNSDVGLVLPSIEEACSTGIVPTTSTVMALALGDALAVTLMEHRKFSPEHFRQFHPGGSLGAKLTKVGDVMHRGNSIPLVSAETLMPETLLVMSQKGFGVAGIVTADSRLRGIITDGDLRRHMQGLLEKTAGQIMTSDPYTITSSALAEEALALMNGKEVTCLFVVDSEGSDRVAGILHIHDCLRAGVA